MRDEVRVVDASAIAALIFAEPRADEVVERLGRAELVAPALFGYELANVCLKKIESYEAQRKAVLDAFASLPLLGIREVEIERGLELVELAERTKLTTYDASYLWLARVLGVELITLDAALHRASQSG